MFIILYTNIIQLMSIIKLASNDFQHSAYSESVLPIIGKVSATEVTDRKSVFVSNLGPLFTFTVPY